MVCGIPLQPRRHPLRSSARRLAVQALLITVFVSASAQTSPARGPLSQAPSVPQRLSGGDEMPLADYLGLLRQIAPAAEDGARTYLAAARLYCGRELNTAELRLAMSQDRGDPVLMGLIGAAHGKDHWARQQLVAQMQCPPGAAR